MLCYYTESIKVSCRFADGIGYDSAPVQGVPLLVSDVAGDSGYSASLAATGLDATRALMCRGPRVNNAALNAGTCWLIALNGTDALAKVSEVELNAGVTEVYSTKMISMATMSSTRAIACFMGDPSSNWNTCTAKCRLLDVDASGALAAGPELALAPNNVNKAGKYGEVRAWVSALDESNALACYQGAGLVCSAHTRPAPW